MNSPYINERRRLMDTAKKVKFAQLVRASHSLEEAAEWVLSPYDELSQLSPKTNDTTQSDTTPATAQATAAPSRSSVTDPRSPCPHLSPKTHNTTPGEPASAVEEPAPAVDYNLPIDFNLPFDDFKDAIGVLDQKEQDLLWDQRIRHHAALRRRKERQAAKKEKAAKKRSANSRPLRPIKRAAGFIPAVCHHRESG